MPFDSRREDIGSWAYRHRVGLCVTLVVYLAMAIVFMSVKIVTIIRPHTQGMYVDLNELAELEALRDRLQEEVQQRQQFDWGSVKNLTSNENLEDNSTARNSEMNNTASEAQRRMEENRQEYERGLAEAEALRTRQSSTEDKSAAQDSKVEGNVTVSFSLNNPLRYARELIVPAYRCQGGGEVVVSVTVDNAGYVTAAKVLRGGDDCMRESAMSAAKASRFDSNASAPTRHTGDITYIFIPQ